MLGNFPDWSGFCDTVGSRITSHVVSVNRCFEIVIASKLFDSSTVVLAAPDWSVHFIRVLACLLALNILIDGLD